ncbi:DUF4259 domain-containing protein [Yinghuangia seranimata]|uniref:DUF4259 domain-containing protein n=1 Tax=Yinghuangia seranimata TaxID=408067 RepID=UPI00248C5ACB|nr:DUF4259 domain-containing protein [Yinghuangia seranimata]MDI2126782.1 DUF4259 domain-containing protein [Yinghuangia seranimata]
MGTWGRGNFDSDTAADHLGELTGRLVAEVAEAMEGDPVELEPDEYWGVAVPCNLELLHLIALRGYVGTELPAADVVVEWKRVFMDVWDRTIDDLGPRPEYKAERREVLVGTFDRLVEVCVAKEAG